MREVRQSYRPQRSNFDGVRKRDSIDHFERAIVDTNENWIIYLDVRARDITRNSMPDTQFSIFRIAYRASPILYILVPRPARKNPSKHASAFKIRASPKQEQDNIKMRPISSATEFIEKRIFLELMKACKRSRVH